MDGRSPTLPLPHLDGLEVVLDGGSEVGGALLVHQDRGLGQGVIAVPPAGQVGLGDQLVVLVHVDVLIPDLDVAGVHPGPGRLTRVEDEADPADLGESALEAGPLGHAVLQAEAELGPRDVQEHQGVHHREDHQQILDTGDQNKMIKTPSVLL